MKSAFLLVSIETRKVRIRFVLERPCKALLGSIFNIDISRCRTDFQES